ncbi:hypothetical protein BJ742DRAFT_854717 [Cladochytrium replicatum]|nr:hypothetical protein BJ742DRAFT_854717 [Cladochytrium replicatum]
MLDPHALLVPVATLNRLAGLPRPRPRSHPNSASAQFPPSLRPPRNPDLASNPFAPAPDPDPSTPVPALAPVPDPDRALTPTPPLPSSRPRFARHLPPSCASPDTPPSTPLPGMPFGPPSPVRYEGTRSGSKRMYANAIAASRVVAAALANLPTVISNPNLWPRMCIGRRDL